MNVNTLFPLVCIPLLLLILPISENRWLFIPAIILIPYFLYVREAYYFVIEDNFLIIKNIGLPFLNIRYKLSEIENVIIADKGWRSFSKAKLRVLKNGKKSVYYRGASLKIEDWRLLIKGLQNLNVKTIVEPYLLKS